MSQLNHTSLANACFKATLLTILDKPKTKIETTKSWYSTVNDQEDFSIYYKFAETIGLTFDRKAHLAKFKRLAFKLEFKELTTLTNQVVRNREKFNWEKTFAVDMLEHTLKCVELIQETRISFGEPIHSVHFMAEITCPDKNILEFLDLLEIVMDVNLIKYAIATLIKSISEPIRLKLANFLIKFGWEELEESFKRSIFRTITYREFENNCNFVKVSLFSSNESIKSMYLLNMITNKFH